MCVCYYYCRSNDTAVVYRCCFVDCSLQGAAVVYVQHTIRPWLQHARADSFIRELLYSISTYSSISADNKKQRHS